MFIWLSLGKIMQARAARLAVMTLLGCALFVLLNGKETFAKAEDEQMPPAIRETVLSVDVNKTRNNEKQGLTDAWDADLYKQLLSGKKLLQEREYAKQDKPTVYLTFDDGPSKLTPQVLDILKKEQVTATFFVCGDQIPGHEDTLKRIVSEGHAIGNHSFDHVYKELYGSSFEGFWDQIQRNEQLIEKTTGVRPALIRAPGGTGTNFDAFYFYWLDQAGYTIYDWDIDSGDSRRIGVPAEEIIRNVKISRLKNEITVLLHDGSGHRESVKALESIIKYFKDKGYAFAPLTTQVEPAQFAVAKQLKWQRNVSERDFAERSAQMLQFAAERSAATPDLHVHASETAGMNPAAVSRLPEKPLEPATCGQQVELTMSFPFRSDKRFALGSYSACYPSGILTGGTITDDKNAVEVPLRELAEKMGAQVVWNDSDQTVRVQYGLKQVEYDTVNQTLRVQSLDGQMKSAYWPYIRWVDERLFISVNRLFEMFGQTVQSTVNGSHGIHVECMPAFDSNQHFPGKGNVFLRQLRQVALTLKRFFPV